MMSNLIVPKSSELLKIVHTIAPPLSFQAHKGQAGRIGVIGGSTEYTGAPYFAAITILRSGADLSHVFCPPEAAPVIKSYSPDLIVHPILSGDSNASCLAISEWFPRLHSLVIGPGLGRDSAIINTVKAVINVAKSQDKDLVIDADGLHVIQEDPSLVVGYKRAILSPNKIEFQRLYEKLVGKIQDSNCSDLEQTQLLAEKMGGVTILRKGQVDVISDGTNTILCDEVGSPRRMGGQGDLLSGSIGLFIYWARNAQERTDKLCSLPPTLIASYAGCLLVKKCAESAYNKLGRSCLAHDMISELPCVIKQLFDS